MKIACVKLLLLSVASSIVVVCLMFLASTVQDGHLPLPVTAPDTAYAAELSAKGAAGSEWLTMTVAPIVKWNGGTDNTSAVSVSVKLHVQQSEPYTTTEWYSITLEYGDQQQQVATNMDTNGNLLVEAADQVYTTSFVVALGRTGVHTLRTTLHRVYTNSGVLDVAPVIGESSAILSDTAQVLIVPTIKVQAEPVKTADTTGNIYVGQAVQFIAQVEPPIQANEPRDGFWIKQENHANRVVMMADTNAITAGIREQVISGTGEIAWIHPYSRTGTFTASASFLSGVDHVYGDSLLLAQAYTPVTITTPSIALSLNTDTTDYLYTTGEIEVLATVPAHTIIGVMSTVRFAFDEQGQEGQERQLAPGTTSVTGTVSYTNTTDSPQVYPIQATLYVSGTENTMAVTSSQQVTITVRSLSDYQLVVKPYQESVTLPNKGAGVVSVTTHLEDTTGQVWIPPERGKLQIATSFGGLDEVQIDEKFSASDFLLSSDVAGRATLVATYQFAGVTATISDTATVVFERGASSSDEVVEVLLDPDKAGTTPTILGNLSFSLPQDLYQQLVIVKITQRDLADIPADRIGVKGFVIEVFDAATGVPLSQGDFPNGTIALTHKVYRQDTTPPIIVSTVYLVRSRLGGTWETINAKLALAQASLSAVGDSAYVTADLPSPGDYAILGRDTLPVYLPLVIRPRY